MIRKPMELNERVKVRLDGEDVVIIYNLSGEINKKVVTKGQVLTENETVNKNKNDSVKDADLGESAYWYDKHFIAWGYQKIKNKSGEAEKKKRKVFYVNKLAF